MAEKVVTWPMRQRQGAASQWRSKNPVLAAGEIGYDLTNDIMKIGNGVTPWTALPSFVKKKYDLNAMSWAEISEISKADRAPICFNVGDEKTIMLSTGEVITLVILGFRHDSYYDAEIDDNVFAGISFGAKNCLATRYQMHSSATNNQGYSASDMNRIVTATLLSQFQADLRSVIIPVNKKTSAGNKATFTTAGEYSIWLLSEVEVNGTTEAVYCNEGSQYAYFRRNGALAGGQIYNPNCIKALSNGDGSVDQWWTRSPSVAQTTGFRCIGTDGRSSNNSATTSLGVSFGFCV